MMAGLALRGLPFLGGFYSKDLVVEGMLMGGVRTFLGFIVGLRLIITVIYSGRLFLRRVLGGLSLNVVQVGEGDLSIYEAIPLVCLGFASRLGG